VAGERQYLVVPSGTTFEHQAQGERTASRADPMALAGNQFFTESLILAQDERWRRA
jgi:hypothetical protein